VSTIITPFSTLHSNGRDEDGAARVPTDTHTPPVAFESAPTPEIPVGFVPTPTIEYRARRKQIRNSVNTSRPTAGAALPLPNGIPLPLPRGPRILMYKQDPSVSEIGIRKAFLPGLVVNGPRDARIQLAGVAPVSLNALGDLIGPVAGTEGFDAVHTFSVVRQTLTIVPACPWRRPTTVAMEQRVECRADHRFSAGRGYRQRVLQPDGEVAEVLLLHATRAPAGTPKVFTCRSLDIVAHETGHAVLDALKPQWLLSNNPPQTGGLHESFGDLTAIFLTLSQLDQCEAFIAQTKADLHAKTFLSDMAEEFGLALGRPNGLRNADNDFKLSEVGTEVHAISQVFTGGIYDVLADIFAFERKANFEDEAVTLHRVGQYMCSLVLRAIGKAPASAATYADVVNQMLTITVADGKPASYRNFLRNRFTFREVIVAPTPLAANQSDDLKFAAAVKDRGDAKQDRPRVLRHDAASGIQRGYRRGVQVGARRTPDRVHQAKRGITGLFGNGAVRVPAEGDDPPPSRPRRAGHGRKR
jgi:hypothetical protein